MNKRQNDKTKKNKAKKKPYIKPKSISEDSFGSLILGCSFTDCGANSAFK